MRGFLDGRPVIQLIMINFIFGGYFTLEAEQKAEWSKCRMGPRAEKQKKY